MRGGCFMYVQERLGPAVSPLQRVLKKEHRFVFLQGVGFLARCCMCCPGVEVHHLAFRSDLLLLLCRFS